MSDQPRKSSAQGKMKRWRREFMKGVLFRLPRGLESFGCEGRASKRLTACFFDYVSACGRNQFERRRSGFEEDRPDPLRLHADAVLVFGRGGRQAIERGEGAQKVN